MRIERQGAHRARLYLDPFERPVGGALQNARRRSAAREAQCCEQGPESHGSSVSLKVTAKSPQAPTGLSSARAGRSTQSCAVCAAERSSRGKLLDSLICTSATVPSTRT